MDLPPTVITSLGSLHTKAFYSEVPQALLTKQEDIILGIDEAGRGPVMGPMVYGISYCTKDYQDKVIVKYGFDDSKKLTDHIRRVLFKKIYTGEISEVGYATISITPCDISSGMLRFPPEKNYNLNEQAHDATIDLIHGVLARGVKLSHVYVDTVGPPLSYQQKLQLKFPQLKFTVAKKADSIYPIVSVASVVAKVSRDILLDQLKTEPTEILGSGYPSDSKTIEWLQKNMTPLFGWPSNIVRFSWQTCGKLLNDSDNIKIEWEEEMIEKKKVPIWVEKTPKFCSIDEWYT